MTSLLERTHGAITGCGCKAGTGRFAGRRALALVALLLAATPALADDCDYANGWTMHDVTLYANATVSVPRDLPNGTVLYTVMGPVYSTNHVFANCRRPGIAYLEAPIRPHGLDAATRIFPTGTAGVGVKALSISGAVYPTSGAYDSVPPGSRPLDLWWEAGKPLVRYQFIKTGPVSGGTVTGADLPTLSYNLDGTLNIFRTVPSGITLRFATLACLSPDVEVKMGTAMKSAFTGVGSRTAVRPFDIELTNCPAGLNAIKFSIAATNGVADASQGVFALAAGSTASGVGIQVRYAGSPMKYDGTPYAYAGYSGDAGTYKIPFEAAYYQTLPAVSGGTANGQLEFTMSYE